MDKLNASTTGAISELIVSADLMHKGYEVFRAMSPSASCDLIALKNQKTIRVEVRAGYRRKDGIIPSRSRPGDAGKSDHYAVVVDGYPHYSPSLE